MNHLSIEIPDRCLRTNGKLSQTILTAAALQLYQEGKLSSQRAANLAKLPHREFLQKTGEGAPSLTDQPPEQAQRLLGSRYLARVLWALSEGEKQNLTPMTAAEIAKFVTANSNVHTQQTNTARFFRECRRSGRFEEYWIAANEGARQCYELSEQGRKLLAGAS